MFRLFSSCSKKKIFQNFWREAKTSKNTGNVEAFVFRLLDARLESHTGNYRIGIFKIVFNGNFTDIPYFTGF